MARAELPSQLAGRGDPVLSSGLLRPLTVQAAWKPRSTTATTVSPPRNPEKGIRPPECGQVREGAAEGAGCRLSVPSGIQNIHNTSFLFKKHG